MRTVLLTCLLVFKFCSAWNPFAFRLGPAEMSSTSADKRELGPIRMPESSQAYYWDLNKVAFSLLPLAPGPRRKTIFETIVPDKIWTMDQIQGVVNVNVPVRGVIVKLKAGGLLVYNPVAPTQEVLLFMKQLEAEHGKVQHIILGSLGLEHKALCGPFTRYFRQSQVWTQPGQWSFPINLPSWFFGFPIKRLSDIPLDGSNPWSDDFDIAVLPPLKFKSVGGFGETALHHRSTRILIVTDAVIQVPTTPPKIIQEDPRALLFHSRDAMLDDVLDTREARYRGWRRMVMFGLFFFPSGIRVSSAIETFSKLRLLPEKIFTLGRGALPVSPGLYPWEWVEDESKSFAALQTDTLYVAPILRKLILNREPATVLRWVEKISSWNFCRILPGHYANDVRAVGKDFRKAFSFLAAEPAPPSPAAARNNPKSSNAVRTRSSPALQADYFLLNQLSTIFTRVGVVAAPMVEER